MHVLKRISISLSRNFGRSALLLAIIFVLGSVISGAISAMQAVENIDSNLRRSMPSVAIVEWDIEALEEYEDLAGERIMPEMFSFEMATRLGDLPYVRTYNLSIGEFLISSELQSVTMDEEPLMGEWNSFNLRGVYSDDFIDLNEGVIEITSGRAFTTEEINSLSHVVLISDRFADVNNLHVGSFFTLENIIWNEVAEDTQSFIEENIFSKQSYDFEVVGIFRTVADINTGDDWTDALIFAEINNRIYSPNPTVAAAQAFYFEQRREQNPHDDYLKGISEGDILFRNIYLLNDHRDMDNFRYAALYIIPEFYTVTNLTHTDAFRLVASSVDTLTELFALVLWVAIFAAVIILSLLILLTLRDNKQELGIYLALGESKSKVIVRMMMEVLLVAVVAIILALFVGNIVADGISEVMLRNSLIEQEQRNEGLFVGHLESWGFSGGSSLSAEEVLASYDTSLDIQTMIIFITVAVSTVIVSTFIPLLYITRLNPKKIML